MNSVYGDFSSDDILAVQRPPMVHYQSTMNINEDFFKAIEAFFRNAEDYSSNEAYRVDAIQNAAFYLFFKAELLLDEINNLIGSGKNEEAVQAMQEYLDELDTLNNLIQQVSQLRVDYSNGLKEIAPEIKVLEQKILTQRSSLIRLRNMVVSLECK
jgi:hypothetical protein